MSPKSTTATLLSPSAAVEMGKAFITPAVPPKQPRCTATWRRPFVRAVAVAPMAPSRGGRDRSRVVVEVSMGRVASPVQVVPGLLVTVTAAAVARARRSQILHLGLAMAILASLLPVQLTWPSLPWPPSAALVEHAATACSVFFVLSPMVQMQQLHKSQGASLGAVSPQTMILMFFNAALWVIWGVFSPMWPVVPGNLLGLLAGSCYLLFCWGYVVFGKISSPRWGRSAALGTAGALLLNALLAAYAQGSPGRAQHVGLLAMIICICLFAAPLADLKQVVKDRSSELLPPAQCCMQFLNCSLWLAVGLNKNAMQVVVCNGLGFLLASMQLALIAMFPADKARDVLP
mmetsp:Transcript_79260/g.205952  ORF Transcript_79260/g.205952 Transcript_79260/m.205952 type:complete len:346 (+) Transcript_79260:91-1128(+)